MSSKFVVVVCAAALSSVGLLSQTASATPNGGTCTLDGQAAFSTPLGATAHDFSYGFAGSLSNCQAGDAASPSMPSGLTGKISAGSPVTVGGVSYQEPKATGNGSCGSSTTAGKALVQWSDGTTTVIDYTTTGAAAAVALKGVVVPSLVATAADGTSVTFTTTRYLSDNVVGALAFEPPDPTACAGAGVAVAGIQGQTVLGSPS
ncbi:MAG: hypothetical protein WCD35_07365 [Mycobacteriales bacterium]